MESDQRALLAVLAFATLINLSLLASMRPDVAHVFDRALARSSLLATVPLTALWFLERRERATPWLFAAAFLWGGCIATGLALPFNTAFFVLADLSSVGSPRSRNPRISSKRLSGQAAQSAVAADAVPLRRPSGRRWALAAGAGALAACLALAVVWFNSQQPHPLVFGKMDCGKLYKDFWQKRDPQSFAKISPEQLAGVSRMALRAYDACQAGDEQDARALLARLQERTSARIGVRIES